MGEAASNLRYVRRAPRFPALLLEGLVDVMVEHAGMLARVLQGADDGATQMCAVVSHFVRK